MKFPIKHSVAMPLFGMLLLLTTHSADAEAIRQPPGLQVGDEYRLAFLTSESTTADSPDIEFYNRFVQRVADAAPIGQWGLEWKAMASTATVSAQQNTAIDPTVKSVPIYLLDGQLLTPSYDLLWFEEHVTASETFFTVNEHGMQSNPTPEMIEQRIHGIEVWTGTTVNGLIADPLGTEAGRSTGRADDFSPVWFVWTSRRGIKLPMYAISPTLTAVPEANSSAMFAVGCVTILLFGRGSRSMVVQTS